MMVHARWLTACALVAACGDPPAAPHVTRVDQTLGAMPIYQRARRELVRADGTVAYRTERPLDARWPRVPAGPVSWRDDEAGAIRRAVAGAHVAQARARTFWVPYANQLVAAWVVEAYTSDPRSTTGDLVRVIVAFDGRVLSRESLVADAAYSYNVFAEPIGERRPFDGPTEDATPHPSGTPDDSYPAYVTQQLVTVDGGLNSLGDDWLPAGATVSSGNNVEAYADVNAPTGLGSGDFHAAAVGTTFPYVYDTSSAPLATMEQQQASITSLFYIINWLHDFWYDAGFDEAAGNAQLSNYGRGGIDGDPMLAEAQDNALAGSRNNANMSTPDDGMSPRMQVFVWSGRDTKTMTVSPSGRTPPTGSSSFGPRNFDVSADIVLAQDGMGASPTDGCTPLTNGASAAGKLVLFHRGNCTYKTKTTHAQQAGAVGALIANHTYLDAPPNMGDDPNLADPTIPTASVTREEGELLQAELAAGTVSARITRDVAPDLDGSLDATLVAHEFGHYIHHRLSVCNSAMCRALSEGWGDFVALLLLAEPDDELTGAYPFSVYVTQGYAIDPGYFGIRRAPYSVDPSINALSFRHMARGETLPAHPMRPSESGNSEVHNAGEIWASALWEAYVALQQARASGESFMTVRTKMARYVVNGLRLAPENASPLETRDALLAAVLAESAGDYEVMVQAFARRGFGSCAIAPPPTSIDFIGIVESTVIAGNPQLAMLEIADGCDDDGVIDTGETATVKLRVINQGHRALTDVSLAVTSQMPGVTVMAPPTQVARLEPFATVDVELQVALDAGIGEALDSDLQLAVTAAGGCATTVAVPIATRLNVDDIPARSATDTFDANLSFWEPWAIAWRHVRESPLDGIWHADDLSLASDTRLTSPRLAVAEDKPLTISFAHRFQFEFSDGTAWDGGVIEYSVDDGENWADIADLVEPGYVATIGSASGNPLGDRRGFVGQNPSWPDYDTVTLDVGDALAGLPLRLRFRLGTDAGTGGYGWDIDDVAFDGIVGTPFPAQVADDGVCVRPPDDPIRAGGGGCCDSGGSSNHPFVLLSLLLLRRGRRRGVTASRLAPWVRKRARSRA